ncbi:MAG: ATP-binding protein [Sulfuricurvum sp.]|uniref:AAA family ATPase n=1 Tax=Sulfuricurvum sp. TaxID=2025608 RepID=UPI00356A44DB
MLKRFTVENFSSFQKENSLDLTAGRIELNQEHLYNFEKVKILKSAVIYGANASGKSNLFKAIDYAKEIVLNNLDNVDTYKKYFRLDHDSLKKPTKFEFEIELNDRFYSYAFSSFVNKKEIVEEWLYEIGKNTPDLIFERNNNEIKLGKLLQKKEVKNRFEIYIEDMKNQSSKLFLSEIAKKELDISEINIINDIYGWFADKLIIIYPNTQYEELSSLRNNSSLAKTFKKYLGEFDTGVVDISSIEEDFEKTLKNIPDELRKQIIKDLSKDDVIGTLKMPDGQFYTVYKDKNDELKVQKIGLIHSNDVEEIFELKDESDGTKRLFDLIPLIGKFSMDYTIIIDEFDRSLHPKLTKKFFELFYKLNDANSKSQLIVTTHESTLLDQELVRRDEVWFVEKDKNGASNIFSLNQFKVRYDSKIEKAYLLGRYGAIPIFKTFDQIDMDI